MPRQLGPSSPNHREIPSPPYCQAAPLRCFDWQSTQESLDLDDLYNDSTTFLTLTTDGDETLCKFDSAFYQSNLAQTPDERRSIMREERERMRAMCFTFRADPFSHRHASANDGSGPISLYPAQPHTTPPLLYSFPADPASCCGDDGPECSEPCPFASIETENISLSSVPGPPAGEDEPARRYIFPSTSLFSVSSNSSSSASLGSPPSGRSPSPPSLPTTSMKSERTELSPPTSWPRVTADLSRPVRGRDPIYSAASVRKPELHNNMPRASCVANESPSFRGLQPFGTRLQLTQEAVGVDYPFLSGIAPLQSTRAPCEPPVMSQSSPFHLQPDKLLYSQAGPAAAAVSHLPWMDIPRPSRRIPEFLIPHQTAPSPFRLP